MEISSIIYPALSIGGIGLIFGIVLGIAAKKFAVPVDEKVTEVRANLPGANCGGCGFAGCDALAKAIASGEVGINACPVCNEMQREAIAKVMGVESKPEEKQVAVIRCRGNHEVAKQKFNYEGLQTCQDANLVGGGPKQCAYGCLGLGSCSKVCRFGAIEMKDGLPVINVEKCVGCGACAKACPRNIIHIMPINTSYHVSCISQDQLKEVKKVCNVGCMGCGVCVKQCETGAIRLVNHYAEINPALCISCGKCADKCPTKAIVCLLEENKEIVHKKELTVSLEKNLQA